MFAGEALRLARERRLLAWAHLQGAAWARAKKIPSWDQVRRRLEPHQVTMSPRDLRSAIMGMAKAAGAEVIYRKKGS